MIVIKDYTKLLSYNIILNKLVLSTKYTLRLRKLTYIYIKEKDFEKKKFVSPLCLAVYENFS